MALVRFFKTNWFSISLIALILVAIARKNLHFSGVNTAVPAREEHEAKPPVPDKYTELAGGKPETSHLSFEPTDSHPQLPAIEDEAAMNFLKRFGKTAMTERKKYGIPASVILAAAYVNSFAGQRPLAREASNYFALPCSPSWEGKTTQERGRCYRKYNSAWESFRDFSEVLERQTYFAALKKSAGQDPKLWAKGLASTDISEVADFEVEMLRVIQAYRLFELDEM